MTTSYLIDGYNLLHAVGLFPVQVGPHALEKARGRLLALVSAGHGDGAAAVTVVFDASHAPPDVTAVRYHRGIRVLFAVEQPEADDLIEDLIHDHASPRQLTVVSDDRRLRLAGQRRRCRVLGCAAYLDLLARLRSQQKPAAADDADKPEPEAEREYWRQQFRDLDNDPAMKELFNPFDFEEM